ncbi:hypothetical protein I6N95_21620 [Vagococcus sp. BWB3-3]|uniref:Uncharacterized protein n=1 Tax=Vagococcus allomyrinae TaxID=2794353 RepID=A0A940PF09_9ENTE|nr:hypothetical protein [Vagococcus allomyrinae]MBP1043630.1 hypothetical protein [Vagococcus allomyrinae]
MFKKCLFVEQIGNPLTLTGQSENRYNHQYDDCFSSFFIILAVKNSSF